MWASNPQVLSQTADSRVQSISLRVEEDPRLQTQALDCVTLLYIAPSRPLIPNRIPNT